MKLDVEENPWTNIQMTVESQKTEMSFGGDLCSSRQKMLKENRRQAEHVMACREILRKGFTLAQ